MRSFIELELPVEARDYVRRRQQGVRSTLSEHGVASCFRWTKVTSVHLTLRFLGATTTGQQKSVAGKLTKVAEEWPPLVLRVSQLGAFPTARRPRSA